MTEPSETLEEARLSLRRALTLGTGRAPIEIPDWLKADGRPDETLTLLAALAARSRFDRPALPHSLEHRSVHQDAAQLLGAAARQALHRLYGTRNAKVSRLVSRRVLIGMRDAGRHLHPFDYHAVDKLMEAGPELLDPPAANWRAERLGDEPAAYADEVIDAENWTQFLPAERVRFLQAWRRKAPAEAREACAAELGNDAASVRVKLVGALATGLSDDDAEYLRSLESDRAASVRQTAAGLLRRIRGSGEYQQRIAEAHEQLEVAKVGVIGRGRVLQPRLPARLSDAKQRTWIEDQFEGVSPAALAEALKLKPQVFADALALPPLRIRMLMNAIVLGEWDYAKLILDNGDADDLAHVVGLYRADMVALDNDDKRKLWSAAATSIQSMSMTRATQVMSAIYDVMGVAPSAELIDAMGNSPQWNAWATAATSTADFDDKATPEILVSLAGPDHMVAWRDRLSGAPLSVTSTALALADFLEALQQHEQGTPNHDG
ncbi:MAG: DUF5691 domain-containing protein [Pseudomonadota bacterium]